MIEFHRLPDALRSSLGYNRASGSFQHLEWEATALTLQRLFLDFPLGYIK